MAKTQAMAAGISVMLGALVLGVGTASAKGPQEFTATLATPPGITTQGLGKAQGWGLDKDTAAYIVRERIAYTTLKGLTLYTYDKDPAGKSACVDDCAKTWIPMPALAGAKPFGEWSVISRPDGSKQWAFKGHALYSFIKDTDPGSVGGVNVAKIVGRGPNTGSRGSFRGQRPKEAELPADWHVALLYPAPDMSLPAGFAVKDEPDAGGVVLVNSKEQVLYAFEGDANDDNKGCALAGCNSPWTALAAPMAAQVSGDFSFINRHDGIKQWAYKGHGLYTYAGDLVAGDVNGIGADKRWKIAEVVRYYMPEGVSIQKTAGMGVVFASATGQTLYRRDGWLNQSGGGHSFPHGQANRPAVGRDIGLNVRCDIEQFDSMDTAKKGCAAWHPYLAPADAQPSGFWDVAMRDDGSKQWVYSGYTLWTYDGDKKAGDMNGHDAFDFVISEDPNKEAEVGTQVDGVASLYWSIAQP